MDIDAEIADLCAVHRGLDRHNETGQVTIRGVLSFEASYKDLESIEDWFEIEIRIPNEYPDVLPEVVELQGKVVSNYEHLNSDGTFCLAVPIAEQLAFKKEQTLLGFVNNLVVNYLYSYCYWRQHREYPFDDSPHGLEGFVDYYEKLFEIELSPELFSGIERIIKYGYRGHHPCPCGSGKIVRKCHKQVVMDLAQEKIRRQLGSEIKAIKDAVLSAGYS